MLLRTHGFQAYQAAQYEVMDRQREVFPFWQYLTMGDDHVRDSHAALNNVILPADHAFWQDHYPPWDFGCRCQVVALSESDMEDAKAADTGKPPEQRDVIEGAALRKLEENGTLFRSLDGAPAKGYDVRSPVARATTAEDRRAAYQWKPGTMTMSAEQLKSRYSDENGKPTEAWTAFEKFAKKQELGDGRTVLEWMEGKEARGKGQGAAEAPISKLKAQTGKAESGVAPASDIFEFLKKKPSSPIQSSVAGDREFTESGVPKKTLRELVRFEDAHLGRTDEYGMVVLTSGAKIGPFPGKGDEIDLNPWHDLIKDATVTHTHRHGGTFSHRDIQNAIGHDLGTIRARERGIAFELERPPGGWGVDFNSAEQELYEAETRHEAALLAKRFAGMISLDEQTLQACDLAMEEVAKKHGWIYRRVRT